MNKKINIKRQNFHLLRYLGCSQDPQAMTHPRVKQMCNCLQNLLFFFYLLIWYLDRNFLWFPMVTGLPIGQTWPLDQQLHSFDVNVLYCLCYFPLVGPLLTDCLHIKFCTFPTIFLSVFLPT